jgi:hypothetical protein
VAAPSSATDHLDRRNGVAEQPVGRLVVEVDDRDRAGLGAGVGTVPLELSGRAGPRQPNQDLAQRRLVAFDRDQVVPAAGVQPGRVLPLAVPCIGGDQDVLQVGRPFRAVVQAVSSSPPATSVWASTGRSRWS